MRSAFHRALLLCLACGTLGAQVLRSQEADSGFDFRATVTGQAVASNLLTEAPRSGSPMIAGFRTIAYPTWKINDNWFVTSALQFSTRPFYFSDLSTTGYGAKGYVLQATLNYSHVSRKASVLVRAGEMSTAFGSFMLRYDDAENPLAGLPIEYGYYYAPVSVLGVAGAQIDATNGKWDARLQFANSSPTNPRSLFAHDQYGNWAGGAGYTIRQGFRVGVSAYRGPYLDRQFAFFFPGEENPSKLPAKALGFDASWTHGHTTARGEIQSFAMPYTVIPTFRELAGYGELKQGLSPRWFVAARYGYASASEGGNSQTIETAAGFRPDRLQLIKFDYELQHSSSGTQPNNNIVAIQLITSLHRDAGRE
jgi:hypothetical protein